jgi:hypothetical protein
MKPTSIEPEVRAIGEALDLIGAVRDLPLNRTVRRDRDVRRVLPHFEDTIQYWLDWPAYEPESHDQLVMVATTMLEWLEDQVDLRLLLARLRPLVVAALLRHDHDGVNGVEPDDVGAPGLRVSTLPFAAHAPPASTAHGELAMMAA